MAEPLRTTVIFRAGDRIREFAEQKGMNFSSAVNLLISEALEQRDILPGMLSPTVTQDPIPGIYPQKEDTE